MKNYLSHFQNYIFAGATLLCNIGIIPTNQSTISSYNFTIGDDVEITASASDDEMIKNDSTQNDTDESNSESNEQKPNPNPNDDGDDDNDNNDDENNNPPADELYDFGTDLIIRAVHPGYTDKVNNKSNVGEFIELLNLSDDPEPFELAGYTIRYFNSTANEPTEIFTFPDGSYMTGKHLLIRNAKSPLNGPADLTYEMSRTGLSQSGGTVELVYGDELKSSICWDQSKKEGCLKRASANLYAIVRDIYSGELGLASDFEDYEIPEVDPDNPTLFIPEIPDEEDEPPEEEIIPSQCEGLEFSEILSYYKTDKSEQFIELFNPTREDILLDGCMISFKGKNYELTGLIKSGQYFAYYQSQQFALTKNPKNPLALTLIDRNGDIVDEMTYPNGQKSSTSFAKTFDENGSEQWQITYAITPNAENIYQKFRTCEEGKIINETTGNCVKVTTLKSSLSDLKSSVSSTLAACPAGKYRNPLTGRCKNIETTSSTLKECAEGYERNPETNRCRKIQGNTTNDGADHALEPTIRSDKTIFIGASIVILIVLLGIAYVILQFRHEIVRAARKTHQSINRIRQNLFSRRISRNRNKKP